MSTPEFDPTKPFKTRNGREVRLRQSPCLTGWLSDWDDIESRRIAPMDPLPDIGPEEIDRLEALAKAVTPGAWEVAGDDSCQGVPFISIEPENGGPAICEVCSDLDGDDATAVFVLAEETRANAAFIAASDPPTVLALCAQARRTITAEAEAAALREKVERLEAERDQAREIVNHGQQDMTRRIASMEMASSIVRRENEKLRHAAALLPTPDAGTGEKR